MVRAKAIFQSLLTGALALTGLFVLAPALAASSNIDTVKMKCTVRSQGNINIYLSRDNVRWEMEHTRVTYYLVLPENSLLVYNRAHHVGRLITKELWMSHQDSRTPVEIRKSTLSTTAFKGRPATLVKLDIKPIDDFREQSEFFYQSNQKRYNEFSKMEIIESRDIKLTPMQLQFIRYKHGMSQLNGLPLRITHIYPNGKRQIVFETDTLENISMPKAFWQPPTGYKRVQKTSQVSMEQERYKEAADMFDTLLLNKP